MTIPRSSSGRPLATAAWVLVSACGPDPEPQSTQVGPSIIEVSPADGATEVPPASEVVITFSEPIRSDSGHVEVSEAAWTPGWSDDRTTLTLTASEPLGSLVEATLTVSGFEDDDGVSMAGEAQSTFATELADRLEPAPRSGSSGGWSFVDVAPAVGLTDPYLFEYDPLGKLRATTSGHAAADYDGDEFIDLYTGRGDSGTTHLYRNLGDGTFADVTAEAGVGVDDAIINAPAFVDHDGDGDPDLLAPSFWGGPTRFFDNLADGTFVEVADAAGLSTDSPAGPLSTYSSAWADVDGDDDLDVFFARYEVIDPSDSRLFYLNNGDGTFTEASAAAGLFYVDIKESFTPIFADMTGDGVPELLVASDHEQSVYFRNTGDGTFVQDTTSELTDDNGMGGTVADYDRDGDLDWFVTAIYDPDGVAENDWAWGLLGNRLYNNQGDGTLVDVSEEAGVRDGSWGWGTCFADLDLDGHEDLFHVNGFVSLQDTNDEYVAVTSKLFHNNGDGTFADRSIELGFTQPTQGRGLSCFDYDRDGDIDLFTTTYQGPPHLYRNDRADSGHFFNVRLDGRSPNTEGVGAVVEVTVDGITQMRALRLGSNYVAHDPVEAHFGLGDHAVIDTLRVRWPDGSETIAHDVAADRFVRVSQPAQAAP